MIRILFGTTNKTSVPSPFISPNEKEVLSVLLKEQHAVIYLADNGFGEYYKPSAGLFDAVAAGQMLILSAWQHNPDKRHVTRNECVALNSMAEEICGLLKSYITLIFSRSSPISLLFPVPVQ